KASSTGSRPPWRRGLSSVAVDVAPLRVSRDFRLLFIGQGVSIAGGMITYVAIPFQVFALTHSSLAVGLLGLTEFVPIAAVAFLGGALADAVDRRRMVLLTEGGLAVGSTALVVTAAGGRPQLAVLFVAAACTAAMDGLQRPSLDAM